MFDFFESMKRVEEDNTKREQEVEKLMAEPPEEMPLVGDKVIVAIGLLGYGYNWIRHECEVLEVASHSVKIKFRRYGLDICEEWIHPGFITDILKKDNK